MNQDEFKAWAKNRDERNRQKMTVAKVKAPKARPIQREKILQEQCVRWFKIQYPKMIIHHSPNGGTRNVREAIRFKKMGTLNGFPDIFIPEPFGEWHGLFIELKSEKGTTSADQKKLIAELKERGFFTWIVKTFDEFVKTVNFYFGQFSK